MDDDLLHRFRVRWTEFFRELEYDRARLNQYVNPVDDPKNAKFMNDACDDWEKLGNNAEPIQPEDLDVDEASFENTTDCQCYDCRESK